mmetsp:Transcript_57712/g.151524  ORF Transcript_57712/g.151524 Transcript_57712/m.151524 type:complete len:165 (-) Transcript_57712:62-556(-)
MPFATRGSLDAYCHCCFQCQTASKAKLDLSSCVEDGAQLTGCEEHAYFLLQPHGTCAGLSTIGSTSKSSLNLNTVLDQHVSTLVFLACCKQLSHCRCQRRYLIVLTAICLQTKDDRSIGIFISVHRNPHRHNPLHTPFPSPGMARHKSVRRYHRRAESVRGNLR